LSKTKSSAAQRPSGAGISAPSILTPGWSFFAGKNVPGYWVFPGATLRGEKSGIGYTLRCCGGRGCPVGVPTACHCSLARRTAVGAKSGCEAFRYLVAACEQAVGLRQRADVDASVIFVGRNKDPRRVGCGSLRFDRTGGAKHCLPARRQRLIKIVWQSRSRHPYRRAGKLIL
jgi:hypothetical protein